MGAGLCGAMIYVGDRLGLFKAMAAAGPGTADELARRTNLNRRYVREWLRTVATAKYVEYRPVSGHYYLPPEHAAALADEDSPLFAGGMFRFLLGPSPSRRS